MLLSQETTQDAYIWEMLNFIGLNKVWTSSTPTYSISFTHMFPQDKDNMLGWYVGDRKDASYVSTCLVK